MVTGDTMAKTDDGRTKFTTRIPKALDKWLKITFPKREIEDRNELIVSLLDEWLRKNADPEDLQQYLNSLSK